MKVGWRQWGRVGSDYRSELELRLVDDLGYAKEMAHVIASYVPTLGDQVRWRWPPTLQKWPEVSSAEEDLFVGEERFAVDPKLWYRELKAAFQSDRAALYFQMEAKGGGEMDYLTLTCQMNDLLRQYDTVDYLTPEDTWMGRVFRVSVRDGKEFLILRFPGTMTLRRALRRFNQRVLLLLSDIKTHIAPTDPIIQLLTEEASLALQSGGDNKQHRTDLSSLNLHCALGPSIEHLKSAIHKRDSSLFEKPYQTSNPFAMPWADRVNSHISAIWKFASQQSREAIWRALEDILLLDSHIRLCLFRDT